MLNREQNEKNETKKQLNLEIQTKNNVIKKNE